MTTRRPVSLDVQKASFAKYVLVSNPFSKNVDNERFRPLINQAERLIPGGCHASKHIFAARAIIEAASRTNFDH